MILDIRGRMRFSVVLINSLKNAPKIMCGATMERGTVEIERGVIMGLKSNGREWGMG